MYDGLYYSNLLVFNKDFGLIGFKKLCDLLKLNESWQEYQSWAQGNTEKQETEVEISPSNASTSQKASTSSQKIQSIPAVVEGPHTLRVCEAKQLNTSIGWLNLGWLLLGLLGLAGTILVVLTQRNKRKPLLLKKVKKTDLQE